MCWLTSLCSGTYFVWMLPLHHRVGGEGRETNVKSIPFPSFEILFKSEMASFFGGAPSPKWYSVPVFFFFSCAAFHRGNLSLNNNVLVRSLQECTVSQILPKSPRWEEELIPQIEFFSHFAPSRKDFCSVL